MIIAGQMQCLWGDSLGQGDKQLLKIWTQCRDIISGVQRNRWTANPQPLLHEHFLSLYFWHKTAATPRFHPVKCWGAAIMGNCPAQSPSHVHWGIGGWAGVNSWFIPALFPFQLSECEATVVKYRGCLSNHLHKKDLLKELFFYNREELFCFHTSNHNLKMTLT